MIATTRGKAHVETLLLAALALAGCESPVAPVSCGPIPQQTIHVGESTTVPACFNDANGDVLTYTATSSNPSVVTVAASGNAVTVTAVSPGSAGITITASDPGGLKAVAAANVMVPNRAPRALGAIAPLKLVEGGTAVVDVSGNFMEPDGQALGYSASSSRPSVATVSMVGSRLEVRAATRGAPGRATITVTARDPGGLTASQTVSVSVAARLTRLTNNADRDFSPAWSPDGNRIAFASDRDALVDGGLVLSLGDLYAMRADGTGVARLTNDREPNYSPDWSPDGARIAFETFQAFGPNFDSDIYVMNVNGGGVTPLRSGKSPAWFPDGTRIAFMSNCPAQFNVGGNCQVSVMNPDGTGVTQLTSHPAHDGSPAWSPDGRRIAFTSDRHGNEEIYVMNADGRDVTRLTNHSADDWSPAWSPDGRQIAFVSNRDGNWNIHVMNTDGRGIVRLTNHFADDWSPAWSPDGRQIAFTSDRDGNSEIYVMYVPASGITAATRSPKSARSLTSSPKRSGRRCCSPRRGNVSPRLVSALSDELPGSVHVRDIGLARATDAIRRGNCSTADIEVLFVVAESGGQFVEGFPTHPSTAVNLPPDSRRLARSLPVSCPGPSFPSGSRRPSHAL